jgi:hypothetical protein
MHMAIDRRGVAIRDVQPGRASFSLAPFSLPEVRLGGCPAVYYG